MELWQKVVILVYASLIISSTNGIATTYNIYLYKNKKKECRTQVLNALFSHLCLVGYVSTSCVLAMILHRLEMVQVDWELLGNFRRYEAMTMTHCWLFIGLATALKQFGPSFYIDISARDNYLGLLTANQILRYLIFMCMGECSATGSKTVFVLTR